jgi:hypothetical protein
MLRSPNKKDVEHYMRAQVCASCPFRTPGMDANPLDSVRPCERECPLFNQLPALAEAARLVDPIAGNPSRTLARLLLKIGRSGKRGAATIAHNGLKALKVLENLFQT